MPIVAELLTVNAAPVIFPLDPTEVNNAVLGVTLPIGVACIPPRALSVVTAVILALLVTAAAVTLPVALNVVTIAVFPPALPNVPLCGPLKDTAATNEFADMISAPVILPPVPVPVVIFPPTPSVVPIVAVVLTVN